MPFSRFYKQGVTGSLIALLVLAGLSFVSCTKAKKSSGNIPKINFTNLSGDTIRAGSSEVIYINFSFSDGNGDLGVKPSSGNFDIYTKDSRDTTEVNYFFSQDLASNLETGVEVSGTVNLALLGSFMLLRPDHPTRDTVHYEVYIKDRAGNESNHFTTPDIYIVE